MKYLVFINFTLLFCKLYNFKSNLIDVVLPCHERDVDTLNICINSIKKNVSNINRIIVVSSKKLTDDAEWFDEKNYPFNKQSISLEIFKNKKNAEAYLSYPKNRLGWIMKQIFNFYHFKVIPNLSDNVLVVDCDTIFLKPLEFVDEFGAAIFTTGTEYHIPYFEHGSRLIQGFKKQFSEYSGISHHMLFQRQVMDDLHKTIEEEHGIETWKAICKCIDKNHIDGSCWAEYEIYFNFAISQSNQFKIRQLNWENSQFKRINLNYYIQKGLDYVSFHFYLRNEEWWKIN